MTPTCLQDHDPRRLGAFRLLGRLGVGGMGTVFLAEDGAGHRVAVKAMRAEVAGDPGVRSRFAREVRAARRVTGPGVARVLDADPDGDPPYLVLDLVDGPTLAEWVAENGPLTDTALHTLAVALAEALARVHDAGIAHRDLKPSNVMLTDDGPILVDFGVAAAADLTSITGTGTVMGSPGWMAPEQVTGSATTPSIDVFTWGAVVAFAATGANPFGGDRVDSVAYRIVHGEPDLTGVDPAVQPAVAAALTRDPAARPGIEDILRLLLELPESTPVQGVHQAATAVVASAWAVPPAPSPPGAAARPRSTAGSPPPPPPGPVAAPASVPSPGHIPAGRARRRWVRALVALTAMAVLGAVGALIARDRLDRDTAASGESSAPAPTVAPTTTTIPTRTITVIWTIRDNLDRTVGAACVGADPYGEDAVIGISEAATGDRLAEPTAVGNGTAVPGDPLVPFVDPPSEGERGDSFCVYERPIEVPLVAVYAIDTGGQGTEVSAADLDQSGGRVEVTTDAGILSGLLD